MSIHSPQKGLNIPGSGMEGISKANNFKEMYKALKNHWNFQRFFFFLGGGGVLGKNPFCGGATCILISAGTTQCFFLNLK